MSKQKQVSFRLTSKEQEVWQKLADERSMTLPKFSKFLINGFIELGYVKTPKVDKEEAIKINKNIIKLGNNINQIARVCNQNADKISDEQLKKMNSIFELTRKELNEICQRLN